MSLEQFTKANFRPETLALISQANEILSEYAAQGFTLTLRQLYYQFVARRIIANTAEEYGRLGRTIANARRAGLVDWAHIEDRTRDLVSWKHWEDPVQVISEGAYTYNEDLWERQDRRLEVWVEKSALVGVIKPVCQRWRVPYFAARGYPSHSELYAAGKRSAWYSRRGSAPIVLYLGDHDPSGLDMTRSLREELSLYARRPVDVRRLALNLDQIQELNLPPNPAKESDKRYQEYVRTTGQTDSWELDALSPAYVDELVDNAVADLVDAEKWSESLGREQSNRNRLYAVRGGAIVGHGAAA